MTEWALVTISTTSIGEMKLAPNIGIRRLTPGSLLGLAFPLGLGFGFALRKHRSCVIRFPISFVGFPPSRSWWWLGWSSKKVLSSNI